VHRAIFKTVKEVKKTAMIKRLTKKEVLDQPIVTEVTPASEFCKAEDYHQNHFSNNPDNPIVQQLCNPCCINLQRYPLKR
jgi:peptide methionine sulfoxide reductase MsrA